MHERKLKQNKTILTQICANLTTEEEIELLSLSVWVRHISSDLFASAYEYF